jgi:DNA-directed RNA polymerase subunit RPC12/RpoP
MKKASIAFMGSGLAIATLWAATSNDVTRRELARSDEVNTNVELVIIGEESPDEELPLSENENLETNVPEEVVAEPAESSLFSSWLKNFSKQSNEEETRGPAKSEEVFVDTNIIIPKDEEHLESEVAENTTMPVIEEAVAEIDETTMKSTDVEEAVAEIDETTMKSTDVEEAVAEVDDTAMEATLVEETVDQTEGVYEEPQLVEASITGAEIEPQQMLSHNKKNKDELVETDIYLPGDEAEEVTTVVESTTSTSEATSTNAFKKSLRQLSNFFKRTSSHEPQFIDSALESEPEEPSVSYAPFEKSAKAGGLTTLNNSFKGFFNNTASTDSPSLPKSEALGVVSKVEGDSVGPFKTHGQYELETARTGLLLPLGEGNRLCTTDYPVQLVLKKPALLSVDRKTEFRIQRILDINELQLSLGRLRLKLLDGAGLWTIRARDLSLSLSANSDVAIDLTGDLITRVFILSGEAYCMPKEGQEPLLLKSGEHLSVGFNDFNKSNISASTEKFLNDYLTFSDIEVYAHKMMAAESFSKLGNLNWPLEGKTYSGILCSECGYAFDLQDQAYTFCPHCQEPLVLTPKQNVPKQDDSSTENSPLSQADHSTAWILGATQAPKKFGH